MAVEMNASPSDVIKFHGLEFDVRDAWRLSLQSDDKYDLLRARLGCRLPCSAAVDVSQSEHRLQLSVTSHSELTVTHHSEETCDVFSLTWCLLNERVTDRFVDVYDLLDHHWYGVGHFFRHRWPLERCRGAGAAVTAESAPFFNNYFGSLQERVLFCSSGVALVIEPDMPLFLDIASSNSHQMRFDVRGDKPFRKRSFEESVFKYAIYVSSDVRTVWEAVCRSCYAKPAGMPCSVLFKQSIWSTWANFKKNITQESVLQFATEIRQHQLPCALLSIDDDWTPHYGDMTFDRAKFPDPAAMVTALHELDMRVALWVHPFVSPLSAAFTEGRRRGFLVRRWYGLPAIYSWWNGYAALVDVTNPDAVQWFLDKLQRLRLEYGVDTFKLDAGDAYHLSPSDVTHTPLTSPNEYTSLFVAAAVASDVELCAQEVRVGSNNRSAPIFFRLQDKDSSWGDFDGLATVIPHVLTQGLLGYPFVLPDMVGGNAYSLLPGSTYPERELYIRWLQLNALLPAMQLSVPPWRYDHDTVAIARAVCELREQHAATLIGLAEEAVRTGAPMVRPLWWLEPRCQVALTIDSQFLLGHDIVVAPVLERGKRCRDVYLPGGLWRDGNSGDVLEGGGWVRDHPAPLDTLPHFFRHTASSDQLQSQHTAPAADHLQSQHAAPAADQLESRQCTEPADQLESQPNTMS